jgi:hypothetical protein
MEREKTFTNYQVASIIYDVAEKHIGHDSWRPEKDKDFIEYLHKVGVLSDWEEVHGKIAKKYRPKNYVEN